MRTTKPGPTLYIVDGRRYVIEVCPYCGAKGALASKSLMRCWDCADRANEFRALQKDHSPAAVARLSEIIQEYKALKKAGYKVPRSLQNI